MRRVAAALAASLGIASSAGAQPVPAPAAPPSAPQPVLAPAAPPHLAAGTLVDVQVGEPLSSKTATPGQHFAISLAKPILYDGRVVVPAGVTGQGEVIDAHHAGMAGKPGEIILAARFVDDGGVRISLKAMKLGMVGRDEGDAAMVMSFAIGLGVAFMQGGEVVIPPGTKATAKLGADVDLSALPPVAAAVPPTPAPPSPPPAPQP
jgi:hypothetical protein